jgi:tight adherence protein B
MTGDAETWFSVLLFGGVFLGILLTLEGLRQTVVRSESRGEARNRRMRLIARGLSTEERLAILKPDDWQASGIWKPIASFPRQMRQAGMTIPVSRFVLLCVALTAIVTVPLATRFPLVSALAVGIAIGVGVPVAYVGRMRNKRRDGIIRQLPDALELMARGLKVGHPLNTTITSVSREMADPIATEFGIMQDQIAYGDTLVDAMADFADRVDIEDVRYLAVSTAIQHGTGGDLATVLNTLSTVIRDRITMRRKIQALSAEGRLTSIFLSCIPFVILGSIAVTAPDYYVGIQDDPLFRPGAFIIGGLIVANYLVMRKLVNFRL